VYSFVYACVCSFVCVFVCVSVCVWSKAAGTEDHVTKAI